MARKHVGHLLCLGLFWAVSLTQAADPQKAPKELIQYVEDAKRLGLKDDEIRQNAVAAGWNKDRVGEALAVVNYINGASARSSDSAVSPASRKPVVEPAGYRIGAGDVLQIVVWKEPEASVPSVVVRTDGKISVPLIKEVEVGGLTPGEVETILTEKLSKYIRDVDVTIVPKEINSRKAYLVGAVRKEGPVSLPSSMTILHALNSAGGLTEYAKRKKIYLLRNENGKQIRLPFDYDAVIRGERPEQNILVRPEDTIVVP